MRGYLTVKVSFENYFLQDRNSCGWELFQIATYKYSTR